MIWLGVAAWLPYAVMKYGQGKDISIVPWLGVHLCGVLPGSICMMIARLRHDRAANVRRTGD